MEAELVPVGHPGSVVSTALKSWPGRCSAMASMSLANASGGAPSLEMACHAA